MQPRMSIDDVDVLLVIAHPDDEAMFFSPFLRWLQSGQAGLGGCFVLCLSTGNDAGLGEKRRQELYKSCATFGIPGTHVRIVDHPALQDGMHVDWPVSVVAGLVCDFVTDIRPTVIVTFDDYGVSGHPNHIATYKGCVQAVSAGAHTPPPSSSGSGSGSSAAGCPAVSVLSLDSTNLCRKFSGIFDTLFSSVSGADLVTSLWHPLASLRAMQAHRSQLVWFRYLFVFLSRYSYVNTFTCVVDAGGWTGGAGKYIPLTLMGSSGHKPTKTSHKPMKMG